MISRSNQRLMATSLISAAFFWSCSSPLSTSPAPQSELDANRRQRSVLGQQKWDELAAALKIPNNRLELSADELTAINTEHSSVRARVKAKEELIARKYRQILSQPSAFLSDARELDSYKELVLKVAGKFADHAYATRCAAVVAFKPSTLIKPSKEVDVFEVSYKLQANAEGQAESIVRSGLVTVPKASGTFPLLGFAHADDQGLGYRSLERNLSALQDHHIVIAPTFPGEPLCAHDTGDRNPSDGAPNLTCATDAERLADPIGESKPWDNDADELLGMYDCVAKVAARQFIGASTPDGGEADALVTPYFINQPADGGDLEAARALAQALNGKVAFVEQSSLQAFPMGSLVGASRGGLVTSVALAKAGAAWNRILLEASKHDARATRARAALSAEERAEQPEEPVLLSNLFNFFMATTSMSSMAGELPEDERAYWQSMFDFIGTHLGKRYGLLPPPAFNGVLTLASPTSIIAGRLRLQLEQMVKGNGDTTPGQYLPGLRKLGSVFDRYRSGEASVDDAVHEVIGRDATFLAPLMFASLKRWNKAASVARSVKTQDVRGLRERGSILMLHHESDKIVPFEQMQVAANIFIAQSHNSFIRAITMSPGGVDLTIRPLANKDGVRVADRRSFDHIDHGFYEESYVRVSPGFILPAVLKQAFAKDWFFDHKNTSDAELVNSAIRQEMNRSFVRAAQQLWGSEPSSDASSFNSQTLSAVFTGLHNGDEPSSEGRKTLSVLRMHAVNGTLPNNQLHEDAEGNLVSQQTPMQAIAAWQASLY